MIFCSIHKGNIPVPENFSVNIPQQGDRQLHEGNSRKQTRTSQSLPCFSFDLPASNVAAIMSLQLFVLCVQHLRGNSEDIYIPLNI